MLFEMVLSIGVSSVLLMINVKPIPVLVSVTEVGNVNTWITCVRLQYQAETLKYKKLFTPKLVICQYLVVQEKDTWQEALR